MQGMPLDDVADAAIHVVVEMLFRRGEVSSDLRPHPGVTPAQHARVQLEEQPQLSDRKEVDLVCDQFVDEGVAAHHVIDCVPIQPIARAAELRIDMYEMPLNVAQRCFDRSEVEDESSALRLRGLFCAARAGNGAGEFGVHSDYFATVSKTCRPSATTSAESGI